MTTTKGDTITKQLNILNDGVGFVEFLDSMGGEYTPAASARESTGGQSKGPELDERPQTYLLKHKHTSPFETVVVKLRMRVPLSVLNQLYRHRTLSMPSAADSNLPEEHFRKYFSMNQLSARYVQPAALYYTPEKIRKQDEKNMQGSSVADLVDKKTADMFLVRLHKLQKDAQDFYCWAVDNNVEKGLARIGNLQGQYTDLVVLGALKNWMDFLKLRLGDDVMWECRRYAEAVKSILEEKYPSIMATWAEYEKDAVSLTASEVKLLRGILSNKTLESTELSVKLGL